MKEGRGMVEERPVADLVILVAQMAPSDDDYDQPSSDEDDEDGCGDGELEYWQHGKYLPLRQIKINARHHTISFNVDRIMRLLRILGAKTDFTKNLSTRSIHIRPGQNIAHLTSSHPDGVAVIDSSDPIPIPPRNHVHGLPSARDGVNRSVIKRGQNIEDISTGSALT
ncbi:hypothetical protein HK102_001006 [Quaeritorhiza haematococci]|nr:hypothetical protein HK102_001006 [Quaeritorhiza haematococci]